MSYLTNTLIFSLFLGGGGGLGEVMGGKGLLGEVVFYREGRD